MQPLEWRARGLQPLAGQPPDSTACPMQLAIGQTPDRLRIVTRIAKDKETDPEAQRVAREAMC